MTMLKNLLPMKKKRTARKNKSKGGYPVKNSRTRKSRTRSRRRVRGGQ